MRNLSLPLLIATVAITGPLLAQRGNIPVTIAESGEEFGSIADAVRAVGDKQATLLLPPGSYKQCAVQTSGYITYKAIQPGTAIFDGVACEGKAALVLRGAGAVIDGVVFQNIGVADGNGAGIRLESGDLTINNAWFRNSEQGILTGDNAGGSIRIDRSTFTGLGRCDRGLSCAHSIYIGHYGSLTVTRSRFERGNGGHYVKSRAARTDVTESSFDDTAGRTTNYMIDLPNGSVGTIAGNVFVQGRDKENYSAFIAVAAEGREATSAGLAINGNDARIGPGIDRKTIFVANWSRDKLALGKNMLGPGLTVYEQR